MSTALRSVPVHNQKPSGCFGCPLYEKNTTFGTPSGPPSANLLIVGEAMGGEEAAACHRNEPLDQRFFIGPAGRKLTSSLKAAGIERSEALISNVLSCQPPNDWLVGAPWEHGAINHCGVHRSPVLDAPRNAILTLGVTATRTVMRHFGVNYAGSLDNWHGTVTATPSGKLIIPTFHPAFLLRGQQKFTGVFIHDLGVAGEASRGAWTPEPADLVVDPTPEWFRGWAANISEEAWVSVDIETPRRIKGDVTESDDDDSGPIIRINFAYHPDQGITVPFEGQYLPTIERLLATSNPKVFWYAKFDVPRLKAKGMKIGGKILDFMWAWHMLQSDMGASDKAKSTVKGNSLGFVAPFYSRYGPWKHLADSSPGEYAAIDAFQELRCAFGIARDLKKQGQWDAFFRHVVLLDERVLEPATEIGTAVDETQLDEFSAALQKKGEEIDVDIQSIVPKDILPLHPKAGWKTEPKLPKTVNYKRADEILSITYSSPSEVVKSEIFPGAGERWYVREPFNPDSPDHVRLYMAAKNHSSGRKAKNAKTNKETTEAKALKALSKKDPLYKYILNRRKISKIDGTYAQGLKKRIDSQKRVHPEFLHRPSTMRLSCINPNWQNVVQPDASEDSEWDYSLVSPTKFRSCVVASPGCSLVEIDYSAIEAVEVGWWCGDHNYIRLAQASVHAYLTAYEAGWAPPISALKDISTEDLKKLLKPFKSHPSYARKKRTVHGVSYGLTSFGMSNNYPEIFPTPRDAQKEVDFFLQLCPSVGEFQNQVRTRAARQCYLGGNDHPFHYKHWFWDVVTTIDGQRRPGSDWNRVVAYYPQSTAAGVLYEACLEMTDPDSPNFIGDLYFGRSPIRALIHDSVLAEVPDTKLDKYIERARRAMERPIEEQPMPADWGLGPFLQIGVAVKVGKDWLQMEEVK